MIRQSGGCLYFEDFRNPGGNDHQHGLWNNLVELKRGDGQIRRGWNCTGRGLIVIGDPMSAAIFLKSPAAR
ncbi:MAG: hypothetical protein U1F16_02100 [Turneriella sp.]